MHIKLDKIYRSFENYKATTELSTGKQSWERYYKELQVEKQK